MKSEVWVKHPVGCLIDIDLICQTPRRWWGYSEQKFVKQSRF